MEKRQKIFAALAVGGLLLIAANMPPSQTSSHLEVTSPHIYKDKLVPVKVLSIMSDPYGSVGVMVGVDDSHFVTAGIPKKLLAQGQQFPLESTITALNGPGVMYAASSKHGTAFSMQLNTFSIKDKRASVTMSGRLILDKPGGGAYLEIVPVTLPIVGKNFEDLIAKPTL
jgi:hypothetical protein